MNKGNKLTQNMLKKILIVHLCEIKKSEAA